VLGLEVREAVSPLVSHVYASAGFGAPVISKVRGFETYVSGGSNGSK
jgi:hypothetical protein